MTTPTKSSALLIWTLAFTLVIPGFTLQSARAQADQNKPAETKSQKEKEAAEQKEFEKKTLALLNDTAAAAWGLKLPENRLFVMTEAAELLWSYDEKRARTLYWDAANTLNLISAALRNTDKKISPEERTKLLQSYFTTFELRQKLVLQAARRDPQLAMELLRATRQPPPPRNIVQEFPFPDDVQIEQGIAGEIAARDPAQALQLARQSLAKGVTVELLSLWHRLNQQDSEKGTQFANDIIAKLRTLNLANDFNATIVAIQLLHSSRPLDDQQSRMVISGFPSSKRLVIEEEQRRGLVELLVNTALGASSSAELIMHLPQVMPEIEAFFPERRAAIDRKMEGFRQNMSDGRRIEGELNAVVGTGTPEEILRRAATASDDDRQMLHHQAALAAVSRGNTDSFRESLNKEISSEKERNNLIDFLDITEVHTAVGLKQLDRLQQLVPKIRGKAQRAEAMGELAFMLKEKGQNEEAAAMLDEAVTLVKTDLTDEQHTNALLTLMFVYAVIDPPKAFALAERAVDRANRQVAMLLLLDKVLKTVSVKKNEIVLEQPGLLPIDYLVFKYGRGVSALAKADFNRTRALAERFERTELRLMAQLIMLKGMLQPDSSNFTGSSIEVIRM
ncbi:MAG TPA: hypothetical protein VFM63_07595 [Pyrinomonadaceae bacterium]|nr:hypothetical protein [Pyrinomonadaceae bacterium]